MKVAELTGAELDYWVSRALGLDFRGCVLRERFDTQEWLGYEQCWGRAYGEWSTKWAHGGPIIEREFIQVLPVMNTSYWLCGYEKTPHFRGSTPLVAAMRAFVCSKYGDEVPDEVKSGMNAA